MEVGVGRSVSSMSSSSSSWCRIGNRLSLLRRRTKTLCCTASWQVQVAGVFALSAIPFAAVHRKKSAAEWEELGGEAMKLSLWYGEDEVAGDYGFDVAALQPHQSHFFYSVSNSIQLSIRSSKLPTTKVVVAELLRSRRSKSKFVCRAARSDDSLQPTITSSPPHPPVVAAAPQSVNIKFAFGICIAATFLVLGVRAIMGMAKNRSSRKNAGSVADLVRRGQLRSDRRGITRGLEYDDPFNNPMVKVGKSDSTVEMCGKVYRLAPVKLTEEQQAVHQKRRSRAYQWKRPTVFLKEGDSVPADVDPDTVRWIPANHPFATTVADIDEASAHKNVRQKHGVPFRIRAEHEALQKKLEALQDEQKLNKLTIDSTNAKDFERAFKSNQIQKPSEESLLDEHMGNPKAPLPEQRSSDEMNKP